MKYYLPLFILLTGCSVNTPGGPAPESSKPYPFFTPTENPPAKTSQDSETCITIPWEVHFSPQGGCTEMIDKFISKANQSIFVQAYSFTSKPIGEALVEAKNRKVLVQIILDKSDLTEKRSLIPLMNKALIPVSIDKSHPISHSKVMIIDHKIVLTGSFNFSANAEKNSENCIAIFDAKLSSIYLDTWNKHKMHSNAFVE